MSLTSNFSPTSNIGGKTEDLDALRRQVQSLPWFHEIDLGNGIVTPGRTKAEVLRAAADIYFGASLSGKSVLDIGCYDGFQSFEAHRRGARRVLATDHFIWAHDARCRTAFDIARLHVGREVEVMDIDVADLSVEKVGTFDLVLFAGVFYHLRHPFLTLERVAQLATETLIVETHLDALDVPRPAMIFYPTTELNNDPTNWWGPNPACVQAMLHDVGFPHITQHILPGTINRGVFRATR
jgi:tRNA (mo5U34)-methyltransferase